MFYDERKKLNIVLIVLSIVWSTHTNFPYRDNDMMFQFPCLLSSNYALWKWPIGGNLNLSPYEVHIMFEFWKGNCALGWLSNFSLAHTLLTRLNQVETAAQSLLFFGLVFQFYVVWRRLVFKATVVLRRWDGKRTRWPISWTSSRNWKK